jgi:hypothetical protein
MGKETKVTLEVSTAVLQMIEKTKEKLAKEPTFNFVKHLSTDDFLNFFFGFSEISQFCRKTFFETLEGITSEGLPSSLEVKAIPEVQIEKPAEKLGYISPLMKKVIDALKESTSLTRRQISESSKLPLRSVEWILDDLSKKGIVSRVSQTYEWKLNPEIAEKYEVRGFTLKTRLLDFLEAMKEPMATAEIAKKLNAERKTISEYLWELQKKGVVERISISPNLTHWKLKEKKDEEP